MVFEAVVIALLITAIPLVTHGGRLSAVAGGKRPAYSPLTAVSWVPHWVSSVLSWVSHDSRLSAAELAAAADWPACPLSLVVAGGVLNNVSWLAVAEVPA